MGVGSFSAIEEGHVPLDISHHRLFLLPISCARFAHLTAGAKGQRVPGCNLSGHTNSTLPSAAGTPEEASTELIAGESLALVPHAELGGDSEDMSGHRVIYSTLLISAVTTRCLQQGHMEVPDAYYSSPQNTLMFGMGVDF